MALNFDGAGAAKFRGEIFQMRLSTSIKEGKSSLARAPLQVQGCFVVPPHNGRVRPQLSRFASLNLSPLSRVDVISGDAMNGSSSFPMRRSWRSGLLPIVPSIIAVLKRARQRTLPQLRSVVGHSHKTWLIAWSCCEPTVLCNLTSKVASELSLGANWR